MIGKDTKFNWVHTNTLEKEKRPKLKSTKRRRKPDQTKTKRTREKREIHSSDKYMSDQINPNPSLNWIANNSFCLSFSLLEYSGINNKFEHVLELGNISESDVCLSTMNLSDDSPPTGVLSLPVAKNKKALHCSWLNSSNISQRWIMIGVVGVYPPPYLEPFLNSLKSNIFDPQIIFWSYSGENNLIMSPVTTL